MAGKSTGRRPIIDWIAMRDEYARGGVTLRTLAAKWNVSYQQTRIRSGRERWVELRARRANNAAAEPVTPEETRRVLGLLDRATGRAVERLLETVEDMDAPTPTAIDVRRMLQARESLARIAGVKPGRAPAADDEPETTPGVRPAPRLVTDPDELLAS